MKSVKSLCLGSHNLINKEFRILVAEKYLPRKYQSTKVDQKDFVRFCGIELWWQKDSCHGSRKTGNPTKIKFDQIRVIVCWW